MLLIKIMKKRWEKINYTYRHKKAFLQVEKQLLGKNTFAGYTHDLLKMFSYFFLGIKITYFLHDKLNFHHMENIFKIYKTMKKWLLIGNVQGSLNQTNR